MKYNDFEPNSTATYYTKQKKKKKKTKKKRSYRASAHSGGRFKPG